MGFKIFSSFDTELAHNQYEKNVTRYGKGNVLLIRRDRVYMMFKVALPACVLLLVTGAFLRGMLRIGGGGLADIINIVLGVILVGIRGVTIRYMISKTIDFYMDYMLITPQEISFYDQNGILGRNSNTLDTDKIKSVSVKQKGLLNSLMNYGSIIFFSEGDVQQDTAKRTRGQIRLNYITNPTSLRRQIADIIDLGNMNESRGDEHDHTTTSLDTHRTKLKSSHTAIVDK